ncbi:hypothetical protein SKAU_G00277650 [Synaphobranchus kaupii]|uniref:Uncharacterized protein n=1 Tax=Synaphobranchus kaupii TaxID=118154 RepID=A0A9Q1EWM4_SYNKA|nr:hypothetical protein SKAU_G00277650 [Synaphobranchus kaupii]
MRRSAGDVFPFRLIKPELALVRAPYCGRDSLAQMSSLSLISPRNPPLTPGRRGASTSQPQPPSKQQEIAVRSLLMHADSAEGQEFPSAPALHQQPALGVPSMQQQELWRRKGNPRKAGAESTSQPVATSQRM